jgi:transposase
LATWRRGRAVLGYIHGKSVAQMTVELDVSLSVVKKWLGENQDKIELHRLPPYSPELNPTEGVWKTTRKMATHNRFYPTVQDRDGALRETFDQFQLTPEFIDNQIARFRSP